MNAKGSINVSTLLILMHCLNVLAHAVEKNGTVVIRQQVGLDCMKKENKPNIVYFLVDDLGKNNTQVKSVFPFFRTLS